MDAKYWMPEYARWRHGGWYVTNIRHRQADGSYWCCGCVSRNYSDRKWRVVCFDDGRTYRTRDDAARAEYERSLRLSHDGQFLPPSSRDLVAVTL